MISIIIKQFAVSLICISFVVSIPYGNSYAQKSDSTYAFGNMPPLKGQNMLDVLSRPVYYRVILYESSITELQHRITTQFENEPIQKVLKELAKQGNLGLAYDSEWNSMQKPVSFSMKNNTIAEGLALALNETEYEAAITRRKEIVLVKRPEALLSSEKEEQSVGNVTGRITDAVTGESMPGANVIVQDTNIGAAADLNGVYILSDLPAGEIVLEIRFLGYHTKNVQVTIIENETIELNIEIVPNIYEGEELVIYTQALGQARAIHQQRNSNSIVNVVSEARLREMADANAAESVGRLPGVSIVRDGGEAKNVAIRGMSSRYNNITVGGDRVPSTDLDGRSVDLNFLSQEMLSGIELFKSNRPDMDADAIGGTVNFSLARIPENTIYRINFKGGYSDQINSVSNMGGTISGSSRLLDNRLGVAASLDMARNDRSSDELSNNYSVFRPARAGEPHALLEIQNMRVIDRNETRDRLGASIIMDLKLENGTIFFTTFGSRLNRDAHELERRFNLDGNRQMWFFRDQEIKVDVLSNRLSGEHTVPALANSFIEWRFSHSVSRRSIPFEHEIEFQELSAFSSGIDRRGDVRNVAEFARNDFRDSQLWRSNIRDTRAKERDFTGQLDVTVPYRLTGQLNGKLKIGGKYLTKYRDRVNEDLALFALTESVSAMMEEAGRDMVTTSGGYLSMLNYSDNDFRRENLFLGNFGFPIGLQRDLINSIPESHRARYVEVLTAPMNNQHGTESISSAYLMSEVDIGSRLMFMPGVRYEYTDGEYDAIRGSASGTSDNVGSYRDTTATRSFGQWFPMFQARYAMTDWLTIRAAYTKSSSRPNYTEIVPRQRTNPQSLTINRGNPSLRPSRATNYDLFFTIYANHLGLFTIGGFYKDIENLIFTRARRVLGDYEELGLRATENNYELTEPLNNPLPTTVRGAEVEWQSNFIFLPTPFNGIVINANFTVMNSETQYPRSTLVRGPEGLARVDTFRVGPMPHQPDFIANASVGYDYRGFSFRVTMLHQGKQLFLIGLRPEEDAMTQSILRWDAVIRQQFFNERLNLYLNLHNITNEPDGANLFTDVYPTRRQYFGRAFDLGFRLNF